MSAPRAVAALLAALVTVQLSGCEQYLFQQSDRVQITSPQSNSTVHEPLTISWTAQDFSPPDDGTFAVFIDRDPMPPGDSMSDFAPQDRDGIYLLQRTSLHIPVLRQLTGIDPAEQNHHDVTVVILDRQGNRIGEYAGFTEFNVVR